MAEFPRAMKEHQRPCNFQEMSGRWIPKFGGKFTGGAYWYECSKCGRIVPGGIQSGYKFCPECGSRNDEEK